MVSDVEMTMRPPIKVLRDKFKKNMSELGKLSTVHKKVSIFLDSWVQRNFATSGGKVGGWKPLALGGRLTHRQDRRFTVNIKGGRRSKLDTKAKVLIDTRRLKGSFTPFVRNKSAGIGSDLSYSKTHDEGIGVPKRRILPKRNEVIDKARRIYIKHLKEIMNK